VKNEVEAEAGAEEEDRGSNEAEEEGRAEAGVKKVGDRGEAGAKKEGEAAAGEKKVEYRRAIGAEKEDEAPTGVMKEYRGEAGAKKEDEAEAVAKEESRGVAGDAAASWELVGSISLSCRDSPFGIRRRPPFSSFAPVDAGLSCRH
jgi:hypothetical protein